MARAIVFHAGYGCDTGCCGHVVQVGADERFVFEHADESVGYEGYELTDDDIRKFVREQVAEEFGAEHVADIDWDACIVRGVMSC